VWVVYRSLRPPLSLTELLLCLVGWKHLIDDETIALFDIRFMNERAPLLRTKQLGGGIWRMKWHPITPNRMLVAAMHAGCRVLNFGGGNSFDGVQGALTWSSSKDSSFGSSGGAAEALYHPQMLSGERVGMKYKKTKEFTEHESMAYGADWFVYPHPTQNGYFEAAARYVCEPCELYLSHHAMQLLVL
jgi:hypothetical protein